MRSTLSRLLFSLVHNTDRSASQASRLSRALCLDIPLDLHWTWNSLEWSTFKAHKAQTCAYLTMIDTDGRNRPIHAIDSEVLAAIASTISNPRCQAFVAGSVKRWPKDLAIAASKFCGEYCFLRSGKTYAWRLPLLATEGILNWRIRPVSIFLPETLGNSYLVVLEGDVSWVMIRHLLNYHSFNDILTIDWVDDTRESKNNCRCVSEELWMFSEFLNWNMGEMRKFQLNLRKLLQLPWKAAPDKICAFVPPEDVYLHSQDQSMWRLALSGIKNWSIQAGFA